MTAQAEGTAPAQTPGDHVLIVAKIKPGQVDEALETIAREVKELTAREGGLALVGTVHFARFTLLDDDRLLFESHFDGTIEDYLDDFFTLGVERMDRIWRYCEGWPGPRDRDGFMDFWFSRRVKDLATYSNYPGVTCKEIEKAVRIRRNMEAVLEDFQ